MITPCILSTVAVSEEWTDDGSQHIILYVYDAEGTPIGMQYRNSAYPADLFGAYWFEKNLQGDIVAVYDAVGTKLITYTYDAWGNFKTTYHNGCTAASAANYNPFRYRGYYYDSELEMYYLQSRYYDPIIGRFINADVYVSTGQGMLGNNMYCYCLNNPVNYLDRYGNSADAGAAQWWAGTMWWLCTVDTALPVGDIIYVAGIVVLCALTLTGSTAATAPAVSEKKAEVIVDAAVIESSQNDAIYYGVDFYGGTRSYVTGPMTFEQADLWVTANAVQQRYSDRASWGLYTENIEDAAAMACWLGAPTALTNGNMLMVKLIPDIAKGPKY